VSYEEEIIPFIYSFNILSLGVSYFSSGFSDIFLIMLLLIIIVPICFYFLLKYFNNRYKQTNFYKNQFIDTEKFLGKIPHNLEAVNLGSNQPKFAFDYSDTAMLGMNWAIGPQSFEYDFRVLKKFHNLLKEKAFVLIPVCPLSFFLFRFSNNSSNYKYYKFLDSGMINNYSTRTRQLYIDYPVLIAKWNLIRIIKDVPRDYRLEIENNPMNEKELEADAEKWVNDWLKQFSLDSFENISLSDENKNNINRNVTILNEMIDFCLERNYRPIIMLLPITKKLSSLFPQSFIDEHIVGNIENANTQNIPVLNYLKDRRFISSDLYFNSFFLNKNGRKIFTKAVINELISLQIDKD
jgi:hypothetical protein